MAFRVSHRAAGGRELRESRFLVTVNPNRAYPDPREEGLAKRALQERMDGILGSFNDYLTVYRVHGKVRRNLHLSGEQVADLLEDCEAEAHIEVGGVVGRVHLHALVSMRHAPDLSLRVDLPRLRAALPPGVYLNVRYIQDHEFNLQQYVRKQQALNVPAAVDRGREDGESRGEARSSSSAYDAARGAASRAGAAGARSRYRGGPDAQW